MSKFKQDTTEFSFILKPANHGVGVFSAHGIRKKTYLRLFGNLTKINPRLDLRDKNDVPQQFIKYTMSKGEKLECSRDFGRMEVGWYLNHSKTPNAAHQDYQYYALRDIKSGEEILIDYNTLEIPEEEKEDFLK